MIHDEPIKTGAHRLNELNVPIKGVKGVQKTIFYSRVPMTLWCTRICYRTSYVHSTGTLSGGPTTKHLLIEVIDPYLLRVKTLRL